MHCIIPFLFQMYAADLCRSFCELLKDITTEGQVQVLKVEYNDNNIQRLSSVHVMFSGRI